MRKALVNARPRRVSRAGALLIFLLVAGGASFLLLSPKDTLDRIRDTGTIRVGYALEAPYVLLDESGAVTGESALAAADVIAKMGVRRVEWIQTSFEELIPALRTGRIDVIAAGMFVTPERQRLVRFSDPTVRVAASLLIRSGDRARVAPEGRVEPESGLRIAVMSGAAEQQRLRRKGWPEAQLVILPDARAGSAALSQGLVDALALSTPALRWIAQEAAGEFEIMPLSPAAPEGDTDIMAFAFRQEDEPLVRAWNRVQREVLTDPAYLEAVARFGFTAEDFVRPPGPAKGAAE
jgi:polar amino acid transport system substrate-binding protein